MGRAAAGSAIGAACALFTWTPGEDQGPGVYTFDVLVSDGEASDTKTITLTVLEVNEPPVLAGVPTSATIDEEQPDRTSAVDGQNAEADTARTLVRDGAR